VKKFLIDIDIDIVAQINYEYETIIPKTVNVHKLQI